MNKIPFVFKEVSIILRQHLKPEFRKINPNAKLPALVDEKNNFKLFESHAMLRYIKLSRKDKIPDHWYPSDDVKRALVD